MATSRGRADVDRFLSRLPGEIEDKVLRGAARAGGRVILAEAKARSISSDVDKALIIKTKAEPGRVLVKVTLKPGWGAAIARWLEYGTDPHFISVDESERRGMGIRRINDKTRDGSLVIGGQFVGTTVHHPGARAHPFLRPSLDLKRDEAIDAAQTFINARITRSGVVNVADADEGSA